MDAETALIIIYLVHLVKVVLCLNFKKNCNKQVVKLFIDKLKKEISSRCFFLCLLIYYLQWVQKYSHPQSISIYFFTNENEKCSV